jgi:hypothetical protein
MKKNYRFSETTAEVAATASLAATNLITASVVVNLVAKATDSKKVIVAATAAALTSATVTTAFMVKNLGFFTKKNEE